MVKLPFRKDKKVHILDQHVERVEITELERICGGDDKLCKALWNTMFLTPQKIEASSEEAANMAAEFEKKGNEREARIWYHVAGGLALWKGEVAKVEQYFGKCAKLAPEMGYEPILKVPEKAVEKAQEFYKEFLK